MRAQRARRAREEDSGAVGRHDHVQIPSKKYETTGWNLTPASDFNLLFQIFFMINGRGKNTRWG